MRPAALGCVVASCVSFALTASGRAHSLRCASFQKQTRTAVSGLVDNFALTLCGIAFAGVTKSASCVSFALTASGRAHSLRCSSFQKQIRTAVSGLVDNFALTLCGSAFVGGGNDRRKLHITRCVVTLRPVLGNEKHPVPVSRDGMLLCRTIFYFQAYRPLNISFL